MSAVVFLQRASLESVCLNEQGLHLSLLLFEDFIYLFILLSFSLVFSVPLLLVRPRLFSFLPFCSRLRRLLLHGHTDICCCRCCCSDCVDRRLAYVRRGLCSCCRLQRPRDGIGPDIGSCQLRVNSVSAAAGAVAPVHYVQDRVLSCRGVLVVWHGSLKALSAIPCQCKATLTPLSSDRRAFRI